MDKELNVKIEEMLKDFNAKNEEMMAKIENLKKSENTIKNSFIENYKEIERTMKESIDYCIQSIRTFFVTNKEYIKFENRSSKWRVLTVKSLVTGKDISNSFHILFHSTDVRYYIAWASNGNPSNSSETQQKKQ